MRNKFFIQLFFIILSAGLFSQTIKTTLTYAVNPPLKKTAKIPVLIMLHGYGSNEVDLFDIAKAIDPRFITFSLRAPNATPDGGFCWYQLDVLPDKQFKYAYEEAHLSRIKILSFISNACRAYHLDSTQVFIMGFSQGSIMAYDIALSAPNKIKGVLALSGRMMEESKMLPLNLAQLSKVKFFIAHGNSDNIIKIQEAEKANQFLMEKQVTDLTYKTYEMPHSISGKELNDLKAWLVKAITPLQKTTTAKK
jgi:phospholipase/carboxylesterase